MNVAHHEDERTALHGVPGMLVENGLEGMAGAMATMLNEAQRGDGNRMIIRSSGGARRAVF